MAELFPLRPHQERAIAMLRQSLVEGHRRPIIQASCGFGKTVLAAHVVTGALRKGKRVAFTVPDLSLVDQSFSRFVENGISPDDIGVIQADHEWRRANAPVQICSVQTVARRGFPDVDFVVVDECHVSYKAIEDWKAEGPNKIFVGLSATPWARGMAETWDDLLIPSTMNDLIRDGFLSPFRCFAPSHPDLSDVKVFAGDYAEAELSKKMRAPTLIADVVQNWLEKGEDRPTLCFAVDRAHAELLHLQFESVGVVSAYVDANTTRDERLEIGKRFQAGETKIIVSVGTMTRGVDYDVRCIIFARPTKSAMFFVQALGRGGRTANGKDHCLVFDHTNTTQELGLVNDIHYPKLLPGKRSEPTEKEKPEKKPPLPRECPRCTCLVPVLTRDCPSCGFQLKIVSNVRTEDGELEEIGVLKKLSKKKNRDMSWDEKAQFYAELKGYAIEKGYKEGYAAAKYKAMFSVWPNDPRVKYVESRTCGSITRSWIRGQQIRYAFGKKKGDAELVAASAAYRGERISNAG